MGTGNSTSVNRMIADCKVMELEAIALRHQCAVNNFGPEPAVSTSGSAATFPVAVSGKDEGEKVDVSNLTVLDEHDEEEEDRKEEGVVEHQSILNNVWDANSNAPAFHTPVCNLVFNPAQYSQSNLTGALAKLESELQETATVSSSVPRELNRAQVVEETVARQREADEKARALQRECCICFDSFPVQDGVECSAPDGADKHFVCNECFSGHVSEESNTYDLRSLARRDGNVFCPYRQHGCADSAAYTDSEVARHVDAETFACYLRSKQKLVEIKLVDAATEKVKHVAELAQLATMSKVQLEVRTHIQALNGIGNLRCPRDENHVFGPLPDDWDFKTECLTLNCTYPGCKCKFCGWCGKGFSSNALAFAHAYACTEKPGSGSFATREVWEEHRRKQGAKKIRNILNNIDNAEVRKEVVLQQARLLAEYGIDANEFPPK